MGCPRRVAGLDARPYLLFCEQSGRAGLLRMGSPGRGRLGEQFPGFDPAFKNDDFQDSGMTTGAPFLARELGGALWLGQGGSAELSSWADQLKPGQPEGLPGPY